MVSDHGLVPALFEGAIVRTKAFFALPEATKRRYHVPGGGGAPLRAIDGFALAVELRISLPGVVPEQAQDLVQQAHQVCPYSNATRGNVDVKLTLV